VERRGCSLPQIRFINTELGKQIYCVLYRFRCFILVRDYYCLFSICGCFNRLLHTLKVIGVISIEFTTEKILDSEMIAEQGFVIEIPHILTKLFLLEISKKLNNKLKISLTYLTRHFTWSYNLYLFWITTYHQELLAATYYLLFFSSFSLSISHENIVYTSSN
jgi:hypothetical protein